jgi:hypothetical protein
LRLGALGKKKYKEDMVLETITLSHYVEKVRPQTLVIVFSPNPISEVGWSPK